MSILSNFQSFASTDSSQSSEELLVSKEETGEIKVLLTSVGASAEETAEAAACCPSLTQCVPTIKHHHLWHQAAKQRRREEKN